MWLFFKFFLTANALFKTQPYPLKMSRKGTQKYKALRKVHSHHCVLCGQTEIDEGNEEMVLGTDVDTMKMK